MEKFTLKNYKVIFIIKIYIRDFFLASKSILAENGEVHITNKVIKPFGDWGLEDLANEAGLKLKYKFKFEFEWFPGYENRRGEGKNPARRFPAEDAFTFIFEV